MRTARDWLARSTLCAMVFLPGTTADCQSDLETLVDFAIYMVIDMQSMQPGYGPERVCAFNGMFKSQGYRRLAASCPKTDDRDTCLDTAGCGFHASRSAGDRCRHHDIIGYRDRWGVEAGTLHDEVLKAFEHCTTVAGEAACQSDSSCFFCQNQSTCIHFHRGGEKCSGWTGAAQMLCSLQDKTIADKQVACKAKPNTESDCTGDCELYYSKCDLKKEIWVPLMFGTESKWTKAFKSYQTCGKAGSDSSACTSPCINYAWFTGCSPQDDFMDSYKEVLDGCENISTEAACTGDCGWSSSKKDCSISTKKVDAMCPTPAPGAKHCSDGCPARDNHDGLGDNVTYDMELINSNEKLRKHVECICKQCGSDADSRKWVTWDTACAESSQAPRLGGGMLLSALLPASWVLSLQTALA